MEVSHKKYIHLIIGLLITLILVLLLFGGVLIFLSRKPPGPPDLEPRVRKEISEKEILKNLTAPGEIEKFLPEEVLESLTAPEQKEE